MRLVLILTLLAGAAFAGPSELTLDLPAPADVAGFPSTDLTWTPAQQLSALVALFNRAQAGEALPRASGSTRPLFLALLETPPPAAPIEALVAAGFRLENVKVAYQI